MSRVAKLMHDQDKAERCAEVLKAVGHPLRLRIVAMLCGGAQHVNGIAKVLGWKQPIISQQLKILRMNRLVDVKRENGYAYYRLAEPSLKELIQCVQDCTHY